MALKAAYLEETEKLSLREVPEPVAGPGEVLVKIEACGICGSDVHYWRHGRIGDFVVEAPMVLGHESAGKVVAVGSGVDHLAVGDIVALEPGIPCMKCDHCRGGHYNLCPRVRFFATPPVNGALQEYVAHPAEWAFRAPDGLSAELASMAEPLSVGIHAVRLANLQTGQKVLIFGAGIIGICAMIAAYEAGASEVTLVDIQENRLERAKQLGATAVINGTTGKPRHQYYDVVFECSGAPACAEAAVRAARSGGHVVMIGMGPDDRVQIPLLDAICREVHIHGSFRYRNTYPVALQMIASRQELFSRLITHRFKLEEVEQAFHTAWRDPSACKVMVTF